MTKFLMLFLAIIFVSQGFAMAQTHRIMVVALDLSKSEAVRGADGISEFEKNVDGVTNLLAKIPADSHVTVIGITDHSFTEPNILLTATISADAGYFGEHLNAARTKLVGAWLKRSGNLVPCYRSTDIVGALVLAEQIFDQQTRGSQNTLVIYSDMRHRTMDLDLESLLIVPSFARVSVARSFLILQLSGVQVHVLGADGAGKSLKYWQSLKEFWTAFFQSSGAVLEDYSPLRMPFQPK